MSFNTIAVLGLGHVGKLAARLLHESGFAVTGIDSRSLRPKSPHSVLKADLADAGGLAKLLRPYEAVLSCLPYALNRQVATTAHGSS